MSCSFIEALSGIADDATLAVQAGKLAGQPTSQSRMRCVDNPVVLRQTEGAEERRCFLGNISRRKAGCDLIVDDPGLRRNRANLRKPTKADENMLIRGNHQYICRVLQSDCEVLQKRRALNHVPNPPKLNHQGMHLCMLAPREASSHWSQRTPDELGGQAPHCLNWLPPSTLRRCSGSDTQRGTSSSAVTRNSDHCSCGIRRNASTATGSN